MVVRKAVTADLPFIIDAYRIAFAFDEARTRGYTERTGIDCFRILESDHLPAAVWAVIPCGHWFGGKVVPAANIAHVAIQPEFRGGGLAADILDFSCEDARNGGAYLVSLFASTRPVYRKSGFNLAGHEMIYEAETSELYKIKQDIRCRRIALSEARTVLEPIYRRACVHEAGLLDRHAAHWYSHIDATVTIPSIFVFGEEEGYAVIDTPLPDIIEIRDWVALNGAVARQILKFIGTFSTVYSKVRWYGAPQDVLVFAMPDKGWRLIHQEEFLIRILDPVSALNARGYSCRNAELTLAIEGDSPIVIKISIHGGCAACVIGDDDGANVLSIQRSHLPSLFSGFRSASFLRRAGFAHGSTETLALADSIFAGPPPWVAEHF